MQGREPGKRTIFLDTGFRRQAMRGKTMRLGIACVGGLHGVFLVWLVLFLFVLDFIIFFFFGSAYQITCLKYEGEPVHNRLIK